MTFRENINKKSINEFIEDKYLGIEKILKFYNLLNENSSVDSLIISYENLCKRTFEEVKKILIFFDLELNNQLISQCIEDCAFNKLQKKEISITKNDDKKALKFREGAYGNFKKDLSQENIDFINHYINLNLNDNFKKILNLQNL